MVHLYKERYMIEKKYKRLKIKFILLLIMFLLLIYYNFDYMLFKIVICGNYIYTDTLEQIYNEQVQKDNIKNYFKDFDYVIMNLFTDKIREKNKDKYTYLYLDEEYDISQENIEEQAKKSEIKELDNNTVYVKITNFSNFTKKFIFDSIDNIKEYKNIIIDLRNNPGGKINSAYKIADLFLEKGDIIAYENLRFPLFSSKNKSKNNQKLKYDNIYILQNENSASSSEIFINALKENLNNVTLIGTKTFGKGIGQAEFKLKYGYVLKTTVLELKTPNGNSIHKKGITPDIEYKDSDIIEYVLKLSKSTY